MAPPLAACSAATVTPWLNGRYDERRWEKLLRLVEERPYRLPACRDPYVDVDGPPAPEAMLAAARMLRDRGTPVARVMALTLVRTAGEATSWEEAWPSELVALRGHGAPTRRRPLSLST
ncbi:hypothetical protein [Streptomyces aureocirculatus]|uniref:hypothetical protein n=1 Tax=Streptomyces aureocirculatus TaxID=67275 RepID=UPI0004C8B8C1|nr:hypothetical protein [Streptomyces aureocirculatus]